MTVHIRANKCKYICFCKCVFYLVDCISGENDVTKVATWVVPDFAFLHKNSKYLFKKTPKES